MNRILLDPSEIDAHGRAILTDDRAAHIRQILRATPGQTLKIGLIDGPAGLGKVTGNHPAITLECQWDNAPPPRPALDLLLALPRPKVLKRLWAQIAALGVDRIFITNAGKVERCYFDSHILDPALYRPRLIEGLQQSGDTQLPRVSVHRQLEKFLTDVLPPPSPLAPRLAAHPGGHHTLHAALCQRPVNRLLLAIGPEGGWTEQEILLLAGHGFEIINMGARILRTDTACIALLAAAHLLADNHRNP